MALTLESEDYEDISRSKDLASGEKSAEKQHDNQIGGNLQSGVGPALSVLDMPAPRTKYAPKKFKGHYSEVQSFLES